MGSFLGVFSFQVMVFPFALIILFAVGFSFELFVGQTHLTNPLQIWFLIGTILLIFAAFAGASLYGFVFGWSAANTLWRGATFRTILAGDPVFHRLVKYQAPLLLVLLLGGLAIGAQALRVWLNSGITLADVIGTYSARDPSVRAKLDVKADGTWDYRIDRQPEFHQTGKWTFEPQVTTSSSVVITLEQFTLGFPSYPGEPQARLQMPGSFLIYFHRNYAGVTQWCVHPDGGVCFQRPPESAYVPWHRGEALGAAAIGTLTARGCL